MLYFRDFRKSLCALPMIFNITAICTSVLNQQIAQLSAQTWSVSLSSLCVCRAYVILCSSAQKHPRNKCNTLEPGLRRWTKLNYAQLRQIMVTCK